MGGEGIDLEADTTTRWRDRTVVLGLLDFTRLGYRRRQARWPIPRGTLAGTLAVVTGASGGLGAAAAKGLAQRGAGLILVARNAAKLDGVRAHIQAETGVPVETQVCDLSRLAQVETLAQNLLARPQPIGLLLNNAGVINHQLLITPEGLDAALATNLLAPFVLTERLLSHWMTHSATGPKRVINVASGGMYAVGLDPAKLQPTPGKAYNGTLAYARHKRALVVLTQIWAERHRSSPITFHAMHPGWADTPGFKTALPGFYRLVSPLVRSPAEGADTMVWLASEPALDDPRWSGQFWLDRAPRPTHFLPTTQETPAKRRALEQQLAALTTGRGTTA
ncbi:MAG: SDR family NAD(P)-dependent oxidoreductase [Candidatus Competibacterales bacterium]